MKASSWATATNRWARAADRLSVSFSRQTATTRSGLPVAHPPLLHGALRMDMTWVTDRIAVGGGIWTREHGGGGARGDHAHHRHADRVRRYRAGRDRMALRCSGTRLTMIFSPSHRDVSQRGVEFASERSAGRDGKLFIHCAAGVHRAPMMTLAVLGSMGWTPDAART